MLLQDTFTLKRSLVYNEVRVTEEDASGEDAREELHSKRN